MVSLTRLFERLKTEGGINLVLADVCRDDPEAAAKRGLRSLSGNDLVGRIPTNSAILFSCAAEQQARETAKAGGGHGVFFYHAIKAFQGGAADRETGEIGWEELVLYVRRNVERSVPLWFPEEAKRHGDRPLQNPHVLSNMIARPVLARVAANIAAPARRSFAESIGIAFATIPKGDFLMGTSPEQVELVLKQFPDAKREEFADEQPRHRVRITKIDGLSRHEVTVGQFRAFVNDSNYQTEAEATGEGSYGFNSDTGNFEKNSKYQWRNPGFAQSDDHPVTCVSWNDATDFCRWLSKKDGRTYRLPTEAEWEYACRAGSDSLYSFGDDPESLTVAGNVADASAKARFPNWAVVSGDDGFVFTAPVGATRANAWGLYDMHGNVWEWCLDEYDAGYYKASPRARSSWGPRGLAPGEPRRELDLDPRYVRSARRTGAPRIAGTAAWVSAWPGFGPLSRLSLSGARSGRGRGRGSGAAALDPETEAQRWRWPAAERRRPSTGRLGWLGLFLGGRFLGRPPGRFGPRERCHGVYDKLACYF